MIELNQQGFAIGCIRIVSICNVHFLVSNVTLGGHMVTVFNELGVNCAVLGTHDFGKPFSQTVTDDVLLMLA